MSDVDGRGWGRKVPIVVFCALCLFPPRSFGVPPANDQCAGAVVVPAAGPFPYLAPVVPDISDATTTGDPPAPSCFGTVPSRSVWYSFTPNTSANYIVSTCAYETGTTVDDTVMAIYTTTGGCGGTLTEVPGAGTTDGCDDDGCGLETTQARIQTTLQAGTQYYVVLSKFGSAAPVSPNLAVQLRVDRAAAPANENCSGAVPLSLNVPVDSSTFNAANDYALVGPACFTGIGGGPSTAAGRDVVYSFTAPAAGNYSFRVSQFEETPNLVLYAASACPAGAPPATVSCFAASNRNTNGRAEEIACVPMAANDAIFLFVDSNSIVPGNSFRIEATACAFEAEANDTPGTANSAVFGIEGSLSPAGEVDFFALGSQGNGPRLFALLDTAAAGNADLDLRVTTTTDTLEYDDSNNDVFFGDESANVAGTPLVAGNIFLRVSGLNAAVTSEPYRLYYAVQPPITSATAESEPNDVVSQADFSTTNYFSGTLGAPAPSGDADFYVFTAAAGDIVYLGLDGDPLRNNTPIDAALALLDANGITLAGVNDTGTASSNTSSTASGAGSLTSVTPRSPAEGLVYRIVTAGNYYARVTIGTSSTGTTGTGDYLLSISKNGTVGRPPATAFGVTSAGVLFRFNTGSPATVFTVGNLGFTPEGIDFRPGTQDLYALEVGNPNSQLYKINPTNAAVTAVGPGFPSQVSLGGSGDYNLMGTTIGFDFNPRTLQADGSVRIRVVASNGTNLRLNSDTGGIAAVDTPLSSSLDAAAYVNSEFSTPAANGTTLLYDMDYSQDTLFTQNPPNAGTLNFVGVFGGGIDALAGIGFDIYTIGGDDSNLGDYALAVYKRPDAVPTDYLLYDVNLETGITLNGRNVGGVSDFDFTGGFAVLPAAPSTALSISDVSQAEGSSGAQNFTFTISLAPPSPVQVNVKVSTANSSATAGSDYTVLSNVLVSFAAGEVSKTINVVVNGDFVPESDETFLVNLSDAQNALIADGQAVGTIGNDDNAGIALLKLTQGANNDSPPGPSFLAGSTVVFNYLVANFGNVPLASVNVQDDNGTPGNAADDFNATFGSGDTNGNGLLDFNETFFFSASRIVTPGQYTNIGTASGIPPGGVTPVTATDPENHFGVAPTPTPTPTPGVVANVATRLPVGTDDNVLIEGFIVLGPGGSTEKIMVRALGPFLTQFGVTDALANPTLEIRDNTNTLIASNNDWRNTQVGGIITGDQAGEIGASGLAPTNDLESAIIAELAPGNYTAVVRGVGNTVGTGIVDAYDLSPASPARLANVATRGLIQPGDRLMIAGFIIQSGDVRAVIRAIGPSLSVFGITNALPDTTLQLRDVNGAIVRENDDWESDQKVELEATGLQPGNALEAAMVATIPPGQYTAQVRGKPEATGIGVVEIYFLQ